MGSAHGGSNIHNQVAQQQIQQLGQSLEAYHVNSPIHLDQIRKAQEMVQSGNVQGAASILHVSCLVFWKILIFFFRVL